MIWYLIIAFVLYFAFSLTAIWVGGKREIGSKKTFAITLFLTPIVGLIVALNSSKIENADDYLNKVTLLNEIKAKGSITDENFELEKKKALEEEYGDDKRKPEYTGVYFLIISWLLIVAISFGIMSFYNVNIESLVNKDSAFLINSQVKQNKDKLERYVLMVISHDAVGNSFSTEEYLASLELLLTDYNSTWRYEGTNNELSGWVNSEGDTLLVYANGYIEYDFSDVEHFNFIKEELIAPETVKHLAAKVDSVALKDGYTLIYVYNEYRDGLYNEYRYRLSLQVVNKEIPTYACRVQVRKRY